MVEKKAEAKKQTEDAGIRKDIEKQQKEESITSSIPDFFRRQQLKHAVQTLKKFELEESTPIFIKDGKAVALLKEAQGDLEKQGKLSLSIRRGEAFEIPSRDQNSIIDNNAILVKRLVLPDEDKILALTDNPVVGTFLSRPITLCRFISDMIDGRRKDGVDVLNRTPDIQQYFVNQKIEPKDIIEKKWELVTTALTIDAKLNFSHEHSKTVYYFEKLREMKANSILDIHVHPQIFSEPPNHLSVADIRKATQKDRSVEWFGILVVKNDILPEQFKFDISNLTIFHSKINPIIGKHSTYGVEDVTPKGDSLIAHFDKSHKAKPIIWKDLLAEF